MPKGIYQHKSGYKRPPISDSWRENLRKSHRGKKFSKSTRVAMSKAFKGRIYSELRNKKISNTKKGKPHPNQKGEKNPAWKGGVTPLNEQIRKSLEYELWRKAVFERDGYTCIWCSTRSGKGKNVELHADHIKPFAYFPELRFAIDNGRTLCKDCHKTTDTYGNKVKNVYEKS